MEIGDSYWVKELATVELMNDPKNNKALIAAFKNDGCTKYPVQTMF